MALSIRDSRRRGFTLIEMLVVVAIVAILIGMLIPVVAAARRSARVTLCAARLRQIGQAIQSYRADHRVYPLARPCPLPWDPEAQIHPPLYDVLARYVPPASGIYRCPADGGQVFDKCTDARAGKGTSYTYAGSLLASRSAQSDPSWKGVVMYDTGIAPEKLPIRPQLHHRGSANVLLGDGSVRFESGNLAE